MWPCDSVASILRQRKIEPVFLKNLRRKKNARTLDTLAQAYRCAITSAENERFFTMHVHNRDFKIAERSLNVDGASGDYLVTSTSLKSSAWKLHALEIRKGEWRQARLGDMKQKRSDDAKFDSEFSVSESGDALPKQWLNKEVRSDLRSLFQLPMLQVALTVEAGVLTHRMPLQGNELTPRASQEMLLRIGWLASALERAASGEVVATDEDSLPEETDAVINVAPDAERGTKFTLSKNTLSIGGDYTIKDASGTTCYIVAGKLRFASTFSLLDVQENVLYSGREHVWDLDNKFVISRDDIPQATILRHITRGQRKILGSPDYRYDIERITGEKFEANGVFTHRWTLDQGDAVIAIIETDGHVSEITMPNPPRDLPFVLAVIMAIVRQNPPSRYAEHST
jgi:uncharacterized protein YxjI